MWPRIIECMLGVWLLLSPFIFEYSGNDIHLWASDFSSGIALIVLSLISYWKPTAWAHWLLLPVGAWLIAFGRLGASPPLSPALQNSIVVGLLILMVAIVPNNASQPPNEWRQSA